MINLTKEVILNREKVVLVDDEDFEWLSNYSWTYNPHGGGYASRTDRSGAKQKTVLMHRAIMGAVKGQQVDHINRNRLDNRRCNLRICTPAQNAWNASKRKDGVTSKYKGVYFRKSDGKYAANIQKGRRSIFLGNYLKEEDAAYYYNMKAKELHGEFAVLNNLPEDYEPTVPFAPTVIKQQYSKYRGVTYSKRDKRYIAAIHNKGKRFYIGSFMTDRIAAEMYNVAAIEIHKENAILNVFYD